MLFDFKCSCGNNKFLIISEKLYEGCVNEKGVLVCEPEEQHIVEIKCSKCGKPYNAEDFTRVEY